ncbi:MAG: PDZ domain-containing protein [Planctomycetota bacterium]
MTRSLLLLGTMTLALASFGCSSGPKPTETRGWIGGEYDDYYVNHGLASIAPEAGSIGERHHAVLVSRTFDETPLATAGVEPGDLIVAIDGEAIEDRDDLYERLDAAAPGTIWSIDVLRDGELTSCRTIVGREQYRDYGYLSFGLGLGGTIDLVPNPEFNVLSIIRYSSCDDRLELRHPRYQPVPKERRKELRSPEGWDFWLGIVGFGGYLEIVDQESYEG